MISGTFPQRLPDWLSFGGDDFEVVLSTEAFYVRNLKDRPFPDMLNEEDLNTTRRQLIEALEGITAGYKLIETDRLTPLDVSYLVERQSVCEEVARRRRGTAMLITSDESNWITLNSSDHFRFRFAMAGSDVEKAYRKARSFTEELEKGLPLAYSERFGFLTSRPTECGTGLFMRFVVHIPGLLFSNNLPALRDSLLKCGATIKPELQEGISSDGHLFTVQTSHTLGIDEETILEKAQEMISGIVQMEFESRDNLVSKAKLEIEDKILRGIGIITHSRLITEREGYALASALRLGASEGFTAENIDIFGATELFQVGKPSHLIARGSSIVQKEMDKNRSDLFKSYLKLEG